MTKANPWYSNPSIFFFGAVPLSETVKSGSGSVFQKMSYPDPTLAQDYKPIYSKLKKFSKNFGEQSKFEVNDLLSIINNTVFTITNQFSAL
jgi:hypothetical protein